MVERKATAIYYGNRSGATRIEAEQKQMHTLSAIEILEEKWAEVMAKDQAGYFGHEWQELRNPMRRMIAQDCRHQAIKTDRAAR